MRWGATAHAAACAVLVAGCSKTSYKVGDSVASAPIGVGGASGGAPSVTAGTGGLEPASCQGAIRPGAVPLSRLTNPELAATLQALLGPSDFEQALVTSGDGRYEESPLVEVSPATIENLHRIAHARAESIAATPASLEALTGCNVAVRGETECLGAVLDGFVSRAFRRPLTEADRRELREVYDDGKALGGSYESGVRAIIEVTLQSPELVYLIAEGEDDAREGLVPLSSHEAGSRLAYFLTGAPPDDELWQASRDGLSDDELRSHARRLLGTPGNRQQLRRFFERHLGLGPLAASDVYSSQLAALTRESGLLFVEDVVFGSDGTFRDLLTSPLAFMNEELAQFYGVAGVSGAELSRVTLKERRGLLTQPAFLRGTSPSDTTRPVLRGVEVLKSVLCVDLPPPLAMVPSLPEPSGNPMTMRDRLDSATESSACASCHALINPVGLALENYDAFGRFRSTENGLPIDASGELLASDAAGEFADAFELIDRIASSADAQRCFQRLWLTEAARRTWEEADACAGARVAVDAGESGGTIAATIEAVAREPSLRYLRKSP